MPFTRIVRVGATYPRKERIVHVSVQYEIDFVFDDPSNNGLSVPGYASGIADVRNLSEAHGNQMMMQNQDSKSPWWVRHRGFVPTHFRCSVGDLLVPDEPL